MAAFHPLWSGLCSPLHVHFFARNLPLLAFGASLLVASANETATQLGTVTVYGRGVDLLGQATAASDGEVGADEFAARPFLRRGELLEVVPGVVVTQHSGSAGGFSATLPPSF